MAGGIVIGGVVAICAELLLVSLGTFLFKVIVDSVKVHQYKDRNHFTSCYMGNNTWKFSPDNLCHTNTVITPDQTKPSIGCGAALELPDTNQGCGNTEPFPPYKNPGFATIEPLPIILDHPETPGLNSPTIHTQGTEEIKEKVRPGFTALDERDGVWKPLGLGSTGRFLPANLEEQLALREIMSNLAKGKPISLEKV